MEYVMQLHQPAKQALVYGLYGLLTELSIHGKKPHINKSQS